MPENALLIGELGRAVFEDGGRLFLLEVDTEHPVACRPGDVSLLLDSGAESDNLGHVRDIGALLEKLRHSHLCHRALSFVLSGLDPDLSPATRTLCIEAAEELLDNRSARDFVRNRLLARPLPEPGDISGAVEHARFSGSVSVGDLYREVEQSQSAVRAVADAWQEAAISHFTTEEELLQVEKTFIDRGAHAEFVAAMLSQGATAVRTIIGRFTFDDQIRQEVTRSPFFLQRLQRSLLDRLPGEVHGVSVAQPEMEAEVAEETVSSSAEHHDRVASLLSQLDDENPAYAYARPAAEIRRKVDKQIEGITKALRRGDLDRAEEFLLDLIRFQMQHSRREHIAMTL